MPLYDYACANCGVFTALRPMAEYLEPNDCPSCGTPAPRVIVTAPRLGNMDTGRRAAFATNERAAHAPARSSTHVHGPSCGYSTNNRQATGAAKTFPGTRPWMLSH